MKGLDIKREFTVDKKVEWWKEAGKEMTSFFGKNCYWIFWRHSREKIERAYHIARKEGDREFTHFLQNLK